MITSLRYKSYSPEVVVFTIEEIQEVFESYAQLSPESICAMEDLIELLLVKDSQEQGKIYTYILKGNELIRAIGKDCFK